MGDYYNIMVLFSNAILYYKGCKTKKRKEKKKLQKQKWEMARLWQDFVKRKKTTITLFFGCEWQKKIRVSKERVLCNIAFGMNGLIFLALLERRILTLKF